MKKDTYKTIVNSSEGYFKDRGSKFLSYAFPVENEKEIKEILDRLKKEHHSARHHCYAWRLGIETISFRANDDGEPSSTAGKPILGQLQSFGVTNVLLVVVRYFGGTLLGTGGLITAYKNAAADALKNASVKTKTIEKKYQLNYSYNEMNDVMLIIKKENLNIINTKFEEKCSVIFSVREGKINRIEKIFTDLYGVDIEEITT